MIPAVHLTTQLTRAAFAGLLLSPAPGRVGRTATIVVDIGTYATAAAAGHDEQHVDWTDRESRPAVVCTSSFAACELERYLRASSGDSLGFPIADDDSIPAGDLILVGGPADNRATVQLVPELVGSRELAACGPQGYVVRSYQRPNRRILVIAGGGRAGTLYGVYDFLARRGVRWFAPGRVNEEVPVRGWTGIPHLSVVESPSFLTRGFHAWEDRGNPEFFLWMARNRLNYWCVEEQERALLHKLGILLSAGGHTLTSRYLDPHAPYPYSHKRFRKNEDLPPDPYPVSPIYRGDANHDGQLSYFEAHPEWYGQRGGVRSDNIRGESGDNFCTSNENAMREWMKHAITDLVTGDYRDADIVNAWLLDNGRWCMCARCRSLGSPTDRNLLFVNRLVQEIAKARRAGRIRRPVEVRFLAYSDVVTPPQRALPRDFDYDACAATFFPIQRCYAHAFDDASCDINDQYNSRLRGWISDPARHYRGRVVIGEYYNVSAYKSLPVCLMHSMQNDIPYYASLGVRDFNYMHCTTRNWGNKALTNWQMARQLWDPRVDCGALWDDYFTGRYGAAAPAMQRAYARLEEMLRSVTEIKYGLAARLRAGLEPYFVNGHLTYAGGPLSLTRALEAGRECGALMRDALKRPLPERIRHRITEDERLFDYGDRTLRLYDALCRASVGLHGNDRQLARGALRVARALADSLRADVTSVRYSSTHANAADALEASGVAREVDQLAADLLAADARSLRRYENRAIIWTGRDFDGGIVDSTGLLGTLLRRAGWNGGEEARAARPGPDAPLALAFSLAAEPDSDLWLTITGHEEPGSRSVARGTVLANGHWVAAGDFPRQRGTRAAVSVALPARFLKTGTNRIEIQCGVGVGGAEAATWYIERATLTEKPGTGSRYRLTGHGPLDLALAYTSAADGTRQRYRMFLPSAYDGRARLPVLLALHGTGGTENSFFDDTSYGAGNIKREAERLGMVVVCPGGRGDTEYRGIGELDVMQVLDRVKRDFSVDPDRIVCSGFSMGGTGTTYLASRHPDVFAGGIALSSCYEQLELIPNLRYVPMLYIQGAFDWPVYAAEGPVPITKRLDQLGYRGTLWMLPGTRHNTMRTTAAGMMQWALAQRRVRHPSQVTFAAYFPHQGRAYWTEIAGISRPGFLAKLDARVSAGNRITVRTSNASRIALYPDSSLLDPGRPITVTLDGHVVYSARCRPDRRIECSLDRGRWTARDREVIPSARVPYHKDLVGTVVSPPTQDGNTETTMGNWMTDMMRSVAGTDLAICNRIHYRGETLREGQPVYAEDLYDWLRPYDRHLCTFPCTGRDLLEILEANITDELDGREQLVQVSGCRYAFDRRRPLGQRIVWSTLDPGRTYTVACEGQVFTRETIRLAGRFGRIPFSELEPTVVSAAWRYVHTCGDSIRGRLESRVRDMAPALPDDGDAGLAEASGP